MNHLNLSPIYNTYFKGGPDDSFISGIWIGDHEQKNKLFVSCSFNGVAATFTDCVFIDCAMVPEGEGCIAINLPYNKRVKVETKNDQQWG